MPFHHFCLFSRLDPSSASPHDPVRALLLLLSRRVCVSAVQNGQGWTFLLHCHIPDLGMWVWLCHIMMGHTQRRCGWIDEIVYTRSRFLHIRLTCLLVFTQVCLWCAGRSSTLWWVRIQTARHNLGMRTCWPGWLSHFVSSVASFILSWERKNERRSREEKKQG